MVSNLLESTKDYFESYHDKNIEPSLFFKKEKFLVVQKAANVIFTTKNMINFVKYPFK